MARRHGEIAQMVSPSLSSENNNKSPVLPTILLASDSSSDNSFIKEADAAGPDNIATLTHAELNRCDLSNAIVGAESGLRNVIAQAQLVAESDAPVLIFGETGTGKEVVAKYIHDQSARKSKPFLRVNCGAIPPELVDSELFGHERGSFTGADAQRRGWFERADGGTLFMDECGELPLAAQVRLLRILQDGTYIRVGGEEQLHANVRVVAATHRNLESMVHEKTFRADLWYRLSVFPIRLPALRQRIGDISALAAHFAAQAASRLGLPTCQLTEEHLQLLVRHSWPGNIRELAATIERAVLLGGGRNLDIPAALGTSSQQHLENQSVQLALPPPNRQVSRTEESSETIATLDEVMRRHIEATLQSTHGRVDGPFGAAQLLRINPHTLRARMEKLGIDWKRFRLPKSP